MFIPTLDFGENILRTSENVAIKKYLFDAILTNKRLIFVNKSDEFQKNKEMSVKLESVVKCEPVILNGMSGISLTVKTHNDRHKRLIFKFNQNTGYSCNETSYWAELLYRLTLPAVQEQIIPDIQNRQFKMRHSSACNIAGIGDINCRIGEFSAATHPALNINISFTKQPTDNASGSFRPDNMDTFTNPSYCFNCGTALFDGVKFCPSCGQNIRMPFGNGQKKKTSGLQFRDQENNNSGLLSLSQKSPGSQGKCKIPEYGRVNCINTDMHGRSFEQTSGKVWLRPAGRIVMSICAVALILAVFLLAGNYIIPADEKLVEKSSVLQSSPSIKTIESNAKIESNANTPSASIADIWRISVFYPGEWSGTYSVGGNTQQFTSEDGETDVWGSTSFIRLDNPSGDIVISAVKRDGGDNPLDIQIISPSGELTTSSTADTGKSSVTITKEV